MWREIQAKIKFIFAVIICFSAIYGSAFITEATAVENEQLQNNNLLAESLIPLPRVGEDLDAIFRQLDEGESLEGWQQMLTNEPVEFPVAEQNNIANRKYYMYFGSIDTSTADGLGQLSSRGKTIGSEAISAGQFQIITQVAEGKQGGASGAAQKWMSYNFFQGRLGPDAYGLSLMKTPLGQVVKGSNYKFANSFEGFSGNFRIQRLYQHPDPETPQIRAYAAIYYMGNVAGVLRVTMTPISTNGKMKQGRVRADLRYMNLMAEKADYTFAYGVHSDLAGNHNSTPTYSLGNLEGLYVGVDGVTASQKTPDNLPYRVYFWRDGYENQPKTIHPNYSYSNTPRDIYEYIGTNPGVGTATPAWNPYDLGMLLNDDPGRGVQIKDKLNHPVYAFKWDQMPLAQNEIANVALDISVTEDGGVPQDPPELSLDKEKDFSRGEDYILTGKWKDKDSSSVELFYSIDGGTTQSLNGMIQNPNKGTEESFSIHLSADEIPLGNHTITVYIKDKEGNESEAEFYLIEPTPPIITLDQTEDTSLGIDYTLSGTFTDLESDNVTIWYQVDEKPAKAAKMYLNKPVNTALPYDFTIPSTEIPEGPHTIKVYAVDSEGKQSNIEIFKLTESTAELTIEFVDENNKQIHASEKIIGTVGVDKIDLTDKSKYNIVTIISELENDSYKLMEFPLDQTEIVIPSGGRTVQYVFEGQLRIVSAPELIQFGKQKYDAKVTRINDPIYDKDLIVKDNRTSMGRWTLMAKLTKEMTSTIDTSIILKNAIRYVYDGKESTISKDTALPIMIHEAVTKDPYNISNTWSGTQTGDGIKLEVDPGDVKTIGEYQGEILWELAATPVS
ncbi:WxL domain-containing protein [Enterococcus crotali]|uniref:WxL domain-containing protein n=1 Tax=Enterococcus crotali TaxID=1453587 RepID=UPI000472D513|nr:WxL domain-containing protein [Enterococcus crotali]